MYFESIDQYRDWLSSDDRLLPIPGFIGLDDKYYASSYGYIFDGYSKLKPRYLSSNGNDYILLDLKDGKRKYFQFDKLIAITFYSYNGNISNLNQILIDHIDDDHHNHSAYNLSIVENKEIWLPVCYPGIKKNIYEISNYGRLRRIRDGFIYSAIKDTRYGYSFYSVEQENGKALHRFVHRLVAWEFLKSSRNEKYDVNHINGDKSDNTTDNLEWIDKKGNLNHAMITGLNEIIGENNPNAKMSNELVEHICGLLVKYNGDIQDVFNDITKQGISLSRWVIEQIKYKKKWKQISDKYFKEYQFAGVVKHRSGLPVLNENFVHIISQTLVENAMDVYKTFDILHDEIPGLTQSQIYKIKKKSNWTKISDLYF